MPKFVIILEKFCKYLQGHLLKHHILYSMINNSCSPLIARTCRVINSFFWQTRESYQSWLFIKLYYLELIYVSITQQSGYLWSIFDHLSLNLSGIKKRSNKSYKSFPSGSAWTSPPPFLFEAEEQTIFYTQGYSWIYLSCITIEGST